MGSGGRPNGGPPMQGITSNGSLVGPAASQRSNRSNFSTNGAGGGHGTGPGCAGACGGAERCCFEAEGSVTSVNWQFVGPGNGMYEQGMSYNFVGEGCGSYDQHEVVTHYGWRVRPCCLGLLACLALGALVWGVMVSQAQQSEAQSAALAGNFTTKDPFNCLSKEELLPAKTKFCCAKYGKFCEEDKAIVDDASNALVAETSSTTTLTSTSTMPPPTPPATPPMQRAAPQPAVPQRPPMQRPPQPPPVPRAQPPPPRPPMQRPPPAQPPANRAQPPPAGVRAPMQAFQPGGHFGGGAPQPPPAALSQPPAGPSYDCAAGFANWAAGWSLSKKMWCCQRTGRGCPPAAGGCSTSAKPFDCTAGYTNDNWVAGWSESKKVWCCQHESRGCLAPGTPPAAPAAAGAAPGVPPPPPGVPPPPASPPATPPGVPPPAPPPPAAPGAAGAATVAPCPVSTR